jgi:hypothetical protein
VTEVLPRKRPTGAPQRQWRRPVPDEHINRYPPAVASAVAALAAVLIGYLLTFGLVITTWLFAAHGTESTLQVLRAAGISWQVLHLVPPTIGQTTLGLLPWGFAIVPTFILWRSTQWALKSAQPNTSFGFIRVSLFISLTYALLAAIVNLVSVTSDLSTSLVTTMTNTFLLALAVTTICILTYAPSKTVLTDRLPRLIVNGIRPALLGFGLLFVCGSLLTSVSLAIHWNETRAVTSLMAPGIIEGFFITLLAIGYIPTVNVWSFSYILGPGVVLGSGAVSPTSATLAAVPAFPLLSILPSDVPAIASYLIVIPILIGVAMYFLIPREPWRAKGDTLPIAMSFVLRWREVMTLVISIFILGGIVWLAASASSGALGSGNLKFVGPVPADVAIAAIVVCGVSALVTLIVPRTLLSIIYWLSHRESNSK